MIVVLTEADDDYSAIVDEDTEVRALGGDDAVAISAEEDLAVLLLGGEGADELTLTAAGEPVVSLTAELYGEDGDGRLIIDRAYGDTLAAGGAGDDYIRTYEGGQIFGDEGNDVLEGGYITEAFGGAGDDIIYGYFGNGGAGSDIIYNDGDGGAGDDKISGEFGKGGDGDDELSGFAGEGGDGADLLETGEIAYGNGGSDVFFPFANLISFGGDGEPPFTSLYTIEDFENGADRIATPWRLDFVDEFTGEAGQAIFAELFPNQWQLWIDSDGDGAADIEWYTGELRLEESDFLLQTLDGTDGADSKRGSAVDELMVGHDGDDVLDGSGGADWLFGGWGADQLQGGSGRDLLIGGNGTDRLLGGTGDDTISAGDKDDVASGGAGADWLEGDEGDDLLAGGEGDDTLIGGAGADHLNGGDGDDVLFGGAGVDYLLGGAGSDRFAFAADDSGVGLGARDHVDQFVRGEDLIDLRALEGAAISLSAGTGSSILAIDANRDGIIDLEIRVSTVSSPLTLDDILL